MQGASPTLISYIYARKRVSPTLLQDAIRERILELAAARKWSVNKLAERSGIAPSVLKRTVKPYATVKNTSTELIARICAGLEIPFKEFWNSPLFDDVESRQQLEDEG